MPEHGHGMLEVLLDERTARPEGASSSSALLPGKRSRPWVKAKCPTAKTAIALLIENARR
jgi:hypothetical protein